jgi:hypothetical protein
VCMWGVGVCVRTCVYVRVGVARSHGSSAATAAAAAAVTAAAAAAAAAAAPAPAAVAAPLLVALLVLPPPPAPPPPLFLQLPRDVFRLQTAHSRTRTHARAHAFHARTHMHAFAAVESAMDLLAQCTALAAEDRPSFSDICLSLEAISRVIASTAAGKVRWWWWWWWW